MIQQYVDENGIMSIEELINTIVDRVIDRLSEEQRPKALRVREAMLADLRAFEFMHNLPQSIPTRAERAPRTSGGHTKQG